MRSIVEAGTIAASLRTCQIVRMDAPDAVEGLGSGFQLGPHLALTNYHVIPRPARSREPAPRSPVRLPPRHLAERGPR